MASAGTLWVSVKPSLEGFGTSLRSQLAGEAGDGFKVRVTPEISKGDFTAQGAESAGSFADGFKSRIKAALSDLPKVRLDADSSEADQKIASIRFAIESLGNKRIGIDISAEAAKEQLEELIAKLDKLASKSPDIRVRVDAAAAAAELRAISAETEALDGKKAFIDVDTSKALSGMQLLITAGVALGPALIPVAAAAAAAIASIGPAALAAASAVGSIGLAFSGVSKAISAFSSGQDQMATSAASNANAQANAAAQIQSAQDGVASAARSLAQAQAQAADQAISATERVANAEGQLVTVQRQAADAAISAAERVAQAQQAIATATENAAASMRNAINSQISAEEALANAQHSEQTAQEALTAARKDAARQLESLAFQTQDNSLAQRGAQIALQDALQQQRIHGAPAGTIQGQKDQLAVDQAQQRIVELQAAGKNLATDKAAADAKGVDGSKAVKDAQYAVQQSIQHTADAQRALQTATENVTKAQVDGARSIANAQKSLADAQRAQTNQAITSQEQIAKAEQGVADARRAQAMQQLQSANSIASAQQGVVNAERSLEAAHRAAAQAALQAGSAMNAYRLAMEKLSPAGRAFVEFYNTQLKPKLDELRKAAETGLLPGLQAGITAAFPMFNQLKTYITNVSTAAGDLAREAGAAFTQPFWHDFFDFMNRIAGPTIRTLGEAFGNLFKGTAGLMQALYGPIFVPIMNWFKDIAARFANFGADAAAGNSKSFNAFLQYVKDTGPQVVELLKQLGILIGNILTAFAGQGVSALDIIVGFLKFLNSFPPWLLQAMAIGFLAWKASFAVIAVINTGVGGYKAVRDWIIWLKNVDWEALISKVGRLGPALKLLGGAALVAGGVIGLNALLPDAAPGEQAKPVGKRSSYSQLKDSTQVASDLFTDPGKGLAGLKRQWDEAPAGFDHSPFMTFWRGIPNFFRGIWDSVSTVTKSQWGQITGVLDGFWTGIKSEAEMVFGAIGRFFNSTWQAISNTARTVWNAISGFFTGAWAALSSAWDATWSAVSSFFSTTWQGIKNTATTVWNAISGFLTSAWSTLSTAWSTTWNAISSVFTTIWNAIKNTATTVWNAISSFLSGGLTTLQNTWNTVWNAVSSTFTTIWNGISSAATTAWNAITSAVRAGVNGVISLINGIDGGVNVVLKFLSIPEIPAIPALEAGGVLGGGPQRLAGGGRVGPGFVTNGPVAIVGEGRQAFPEYVIPTDPAHRSNARTLYGQLGPQLLAAGGIVGTFGPPPVPSNAGALSTISSTLGDVTKWIGGGVQAVIASIVDAVKGALPAGGMADLGGGTAKHALDGFAKFISEKFTAMQATIIGGSPGGGAAQWAPLILQALAELGQPASLLAAVERRINLESGGNPNAINLTDSNARAGHPSQGLMQCIPSTFAAYAGPYAGRPITDPLANIYAGLNYAIHRYGSIAAVDPINKPGGYANGGLVNRPTNAIIGEAGPELVLPLSRPERMAELLRQAGVGKALAANPQAAQGQISAMVGMAGVEHRLDELTTMLRRRGAGATINVHDQSGDPTETARSTVLALRLS